MTEPAPADAPVRASETVSMSTTAKVTAVVEAHDARLAARSQLHPVAQALDQIGDLVGICAVAAICIAGKLSGESAAVIILLILGVQTGLRGGLARIGAPRAGALAIVGLAAVQVGHVLAASGAQPGYLRLPRFVRRALRWLAG